MGEHDVMVETGLRIGFSLSRAPASPSPFATRGPSVLIGATYLP